MTAFILEDDNGTQQPFDNRAEAEEAKDELEAIGANVELKTASSDGGTVTVEEEEAEGDSDADKYWSETDQEGIITVDVDGFDVELPANVVEEFDEDHVRGIAEDLAVIDQRGPESELDGSDSDNEFETGNEIARSQSQNEQASNTVGGNDLPDSPDVTEDPVSWMPEHFIDVIEGVPSVNRKGYAVLAKHFDILVQSEPITYPGESDWEYAEFRATATTPEGDEYTGYGSAHVDRGDDKGVLGELAETRACKRSIAWATGVGMVAIEEMQNSTEGVE